MEASSSQVEFKPAEATEAAPDEDCSLSANRWRAWTGTRLSRARSLEGEIERQVSQNSSAVVTSTQEQQRCEQSVQAKLVEVMQISKDLSKELDAAIKRVDFMITNVRDSVKKVERAHCSKWAPLCVVTRRMQIRERRPYPERDAWQVAMEAERDALTTARQELHARSMYTKELFDEFASIRQEMQEDLRKKRHTGQVEHLCLLEGKQRRAVKSAELLANPNMQDVINAGDPDSPGDADCGSARANEEDRQASTRRAISKASQLIEEATLRCRQNDQVIAICEQECTKATALVETRMHRHIAALVASKKPLEERLAVSEQAVSVGTVSAENTQRRGRQHQGPLQAVTRQFEVRQQRIQGENIRDRVHDRLEDHLSTLKQTVSSLSTNAEATSELVHDLSETRARIAEALRVKSAEIRVDMQCTKVTLQNASTRVRTAASAEIMEDEGQSPSLEASSSTSIVTSKSCDAIVSKPTNGKSIVALKKGHKNVHNGVPEHQPLSART